MYECFSYGMWVRKVGVNIFLSLLYLATAGQELSEHTNVKVYLTFFFLQVYL